MPRRIRIASGGYAYHVLNRAVGRTRIFGKQRDFEALEEVIGRWSSLWHRVHGDEAGPLDDGPLPLPRRWRHNMQRPQTEAELESLRRSVVRSASFGQPSWQDRTAKKLSLQSTLRPRGRPWKTIPAS